LSNITGDPKYGNAVEEAIRYAFENLQTPSGLLYWGGHAAYDAQADKPLNQALLKQDFDHNR
jgi:pectate lyase